MTEMVFKLSPGAVRALGEYVDDTGLGIDEAAEELIVASATKLVRIRRPEVSLNGHGDVKDRFLTALRDLGSVSGACEATVISEGLPYGWARRDTQFARAFDRVRAELRDARRAERVPDSLLAMSV